MSKFIDVNNKDLIRFTKRLDKVHRSRLPTAVAFTLNELSWKTKAKHLLPEARKKYTVRRPNFFKAYSVATKAKGFDINRMNTRVGMRPNDQSGASSNASRNMPTQQGGGRIQSRAFIPRPGARKGGTDQGLVEKKNELKKISQIYKTQDAKGSNERNRFQRTVAFALKRKRVGYVMQKSHVLYRVRKNDGQYKMKPFKKKSYNFSTEAIYSVSRSRAVAVKRREFVDKAAAIAYRDAKKIYEKHAKKQLARK
jgi:hypothetical protein